MGGGQRRAAVQHSRMGTEGRTSGERRRSPNGDIISAVVERFRCEVGLNPKALPDSPVQRNPQHVAAIE